MARKHSRHGPPVELQDDGPLAGPSVFWLCVPSLGKNIAWHHPVPKSRGGRDGVPMHPICQQTLTANFTNSELQRHAFGVDAVLANPSMRRFVDWVAKKDPDFKRRSIAASLIGGIAETQEMLDFCAEKGVVADIELIAIQGIDEAYDRMQRSDVKYRFVIDNRTLGQ